MKKIGKYKYYILSFLIPMSLLLSMIILKKFNLSDDTFLPSDARAQYVSLFSYFKDILSGKESLFYSFNNGLGGNMYSVFTYYLSSPLNLLIIFFNHENLSLFVSILILLKICLSGLTMNIYISQKFKMKSISTLLFSTCYALMSFSVNYYFNAMWFDSIYLLPLIMLGIDKLIFKNKPFLYCTSLFFCLISNFYTGYMVCIFCVIYFIYNLIMNTKNVVNYKIIIFNFLICSLLTGFCSSFIWLPMILDAKNYARDGLTFSNVSFYEKVLYLLKGLFLGEHNCKELINEKGTYLYCSYFVIFFVYLYFFNKKILKKEKIYSFIILIFLILSCIVSPLQYLWHGFSAINFFNNRFSFILSFYLIFLACQQYQNFEVVKLKFIVIFVIVYNLIGILLIINKVPLYYYHILTMDFFIMIYILITYMLKGNLNVILTIIFVFLELFLNLDLSFIVNKDKSINFKKFYTSFCPRINNIDTNYRLDQNYLYGGIDGIMCGYSSITRFLSTVTKSDFEFLYKAGYPAYYVTVLNELENTPVIDSILGVRYYISKYDNQYLKKDKFITLSSYDNTKKKETTYDYNLYENPDALSIGYMIHSKRINNKLNFFEFQNELMKSISGIDKSPLKKISIQKKTNLIYELDSSFVTKIYFKLDTDRKFSFSNTKIWDIYINDKLQDNFNSSIFNYINENNDETLNLKIDTDFFVKNVEAYIIDKKVFQEQIEKIKKNQATNIIKKKNNLTFEVNNDIDGTFMITIPYNTNFSIYVDNKKVSYYSVFDYFTGFDLKKGSHSIKLVYYPKELFFSVFISIFSFASLIVFCKKMSIKSNNI